MSINIGNASPELRARLNYSYREPYIITSGVTDIVTGQFLDSNRAVVSYTSPFTGTQYHIQIVPEQYGSFGILPSISLSSNNTGICSIDVAGDTLFNATGNVTIIGTYNAPLSRAGQTISLLLSNITGGGQSTTTISYTPDPIDVSKHVLIVYNSGTIDSTNLKTYYTGHRPQFSGANILNINCVSGESISYAGFTTTIRQPIVDWMISNSGNKPIRYIVLLQDIPTRVIADSDFFHGMSVCYQLSESLQQLGIRNGTKYNWYVDRYSCAKYQKTCALISHINFNNYYDNVGYIDRISLNQTGIYLTGNRNNTGYYFEDVGNLYNTSHSGFVSGRYLQAISGEFPNGKYVYKSYGQSHISTGNNVAGYCSWGANGGMGGNYANDGSLRWGTGNWYIMTTIESYNGQRNTWQGNYIDWFSSGAFGSTGWENCPVGAVGHVEEPWLNGVAYTGLFMLWQRGWPFIECAWQSHNVGYFACFGDPLICV